MIKYFYWGDWMNQLKRLNFSEVTSYTRQLCSVVTGECYEVVTAGICLNDHGILKDYLTCFVCPFDEISQAMDYVQSMNGCDKEEFSLPAHYCHITTFENNKHSRSQISFDENDELDIKARFNEDFHYVDIFFRRFLLYHNLFHDQLDIYFNELVDQEKSSYLYNNFKKK